MLSILARKKSCMKAGLVLEPNPIGVYGPCYCTRTAMIQTIAGITTVKLPAKQAVLNIYWLSNYGNARAASCLGTSIGAGTTLRGNSSKQR